MGGGEFKDYLVFALPFPEPTALVASLQQRYPHLKITYLKTSSSKSNPSEIPPETYLTATIWVTFHNLPPNAETVPNLTLLHLFTAGIDHLANHPILTDSTIPITTSSGVSAPPIAEWILMTSLAQTTHFTTTLSWQRNHHWGPPPLTPDHPSQSEDPQPPRRDWLNHRVGIAGYGSIGRQTARLFHGLGAQIIAYTASPRPTPSSRHHNGYIVPGTGDPDGTIPTAWYSGTSRADLHNFLRQNLDLLVISLPLTPATEKLIGAAELSILSAACTTPGGPYLANVARGKIVDTDALVAALNSGVLAGTSLDVTEPEPLPDDHPLWEARNAIVSPHVSAGGGGEYLNRAFDVLAENLRRREKGEKLVNEVKRGRGY